MKIKKNDLEQMYSFAGVDKDKLYKALLEWGTNGINDTKLKREWSKENPTRNYCYVVSEMVYHYFKVDGVKPMILKVEGDSSNHRFLLYPNNVVVDLTAEQFDDYDNRIHYSKAKQCGFMWTKNGVSKRATKLFELYNKY
jgi:hypothetical protein